MVSTHSISLAADRTVRIWRVQGNAPLLGAYSFTSQGGAVLNAYYSEIGTSGQAAITTLDHFSLVSERASVASATRLNILNQSSVEVSELGMGGSIHVNQSTLSVPRQLTLSGAAQLSLEGNAVANLSTIDMRGTSTIAIGNLSTLNCSGRFELSGGTVRIDEGGTLNFTGSDQRLVLTGSGTRLQLNRNWEMPIGTGVFAMPATQISASGKLDIGIGGSGMLTTIGSSVMIQGTSDWGRGAGGTASVGLTSGTQATVHDLRFGTEQGSAILGVEGTSTRLQIAGALEAGGGTAARQVSISVNGGTLEVLSDATLNNFADLDLKAGTLRLRSTATVNAGARIDWTGGTLDMANSSLIVNGGTIDRAALARELSGASTLKISAGGIFAGTANFDIAKSNISGTLQIDGPSSLFTAGGISEWGSGAGRLVSVEIANEGQATLASLRAGTDSAVASISINSGGMLSAGALVLGGGGGSANVMIDTPGSPAIVVTSNSELKQGTTITVAAGGLDVGGRLLLEGEAKILPASPAAEPVIRTRELAVASTSKIDLGSGSLIIDYVGSSPIDAVRNWVRLGYHGGDWGGMGITSSACAGDPTLALAYFDDGDLILVTQRLAGDTSGDGSVNFDDLLRLAQHYGSSSGTWLDGDFTYDGIVGFDDLLKLAQNYGAAGVTAHQAQQLGQTLLADFALARSLVPEPVTAAWLSTVTVMLRGRRRRAI